MVDIDGKHWKKVFDQRDQDHVRKRVTGLAIGFLSEIQFNARIGPQDPKCTACQSKLDLAAYKPGMTGELTCTCGKTMPTEPTPEWVRAFDPKAVQLFNVAPQASGAAPVVATAAAKPVSFGCPECGANLKVTADSPRVLECQYCKTDLFLPDALWRALHPVRKRGAWYVQFA